MAAIGRAWERRVQVMAIKSQLTSNLNQAALEIMESEGLVKPKNSDTPARDDRAKPEGAGAPDAKSSSNSPASCAPFASSPGDASNLGIALFEEPREKSGSMSSSLEHKTNLPFMQAFRFALSALKAADRRKALDIYYAARKYNTWVTAKDDPPTPKQFKSWLDETFPDRQDIGMVLADMQYLDEDAYNKALEWRKSRNGVQNLAPEIYETFSLPSGRTAYDAERDANAPRTMAEVRERAARGEDTEKNLTRALSRAWHHQLDR